MKKMMYVLPLVCAVVLLSCSGMFAAQKGAAVSLKIPAAALYKSMQAPGAVAARNAARNAYSRSADDNDFAEYIEVTLTTNGVTRSVKQPFTADIPPDETLSVQFTNVPTGGRAVITIEAYSQYTSAVGPVKYTAFIGDGTIASVTAGENAVTIKLAKAIPNAIMMPDIKNNIMNLYYRNSLTGANIPIAAGDKKIENIMEDSFRYALNADGSVRFSYNTFSDSYLARFIFKQGKLEDPVPSGLVAGKIMGIAYSGKTGIEYRLALANDGTGSLYKGPTNASLLLTGASFTNVDALAVTSDDDNDYVFIAGENSGDKQIVKFSIPHGELERTATKMTFIRYSDILTYSAWSTDCLVADMIVHEGSLWVLWRDVDNQFTSASYYSRGALIKLDLNLTSATHTNYGITSGNHPTSENPQDEFFGPSRFIGVMPKKLIIADDGGHAPSYAGPPAPIPQKNRIVTIDTDTGAMAASDVDVDVEFLYTITGSNSW